MPAVATAQSLGDQEPPDSAGNRAQPAYDAIGVRLGDFEIYPTFAVTSAYDSNVFAREVDVVSDSALTLTPAVRAEFERPGTSFSLSGQARIRRYMELTRQNDEQYRAELSGSYEISRSTSVSADLDWARSTAARGTFENGLQVGDPLRTDRLTGRFTVSHRFNRLALRGLLSADRFRYDDVRLDDGTVIDQSFRNGRRVGGSLSAAYEISPRFSLTAQGTADRYDYFDDRPLRNRDARGYSLTAGGRYELTRLLVVDLGAGIRKHDFKNPLFGDISGLALNGRIRWYPTPLVSLRFDLAQSTSTSAFDSVSAVNVTRAELSGDYEFRRNVVFSGSIAQSHERYSGIGLSSDYLTLSARANWKVNRWMRVGGQTTYERRTRSDPGAIPTFDAWRFQLTLTLAR